MIAYYNEIDPFCCQWLRNLIAANKIPNGDVDERDIREVSPSDLRGYSQLHLFAGIGGFAYAARLAGWPDDRPILTAGFPCQDISNAGSKLGLSGARSGLWNETRNLICELRPCIALLENSTALTYTGLGTILSDLAEIGFNAEWDCLRASDFGAEHERERAYIVSYPHGLNGQKRMGIFPFDEAKIFAARNRNSDQIWLASTRPTPDMVDGLSTGMVKRHATKAIGNSIVPQVAAEIIKLFLDKANREQGQKIEI